MGTSLAEPGGLSIPFTRAQDSKRAREFGAEGIGLCRTEHMFFEEDRIMAMREMIVAEDQASRRKALKKLLPFQRKDFVGIFTAMKGLPVTIRLLDRRSKLCRCDGTSYR